MNHINVPKVNKTYINKEIEDVSLVRIVFIAWGKNEVVVKNAATNPVVVIQFIFLFNISKVIL